MRERSPASFVTHGYTLLELTLVVAIVAVLAAVALPSLQPAEDQRLTSAAHSVAATLRFAHAEALRRGAAVLVEIDANTNRLRVAEADLGAAMVAVGAILTDPITKQPLDLVLADSATSAGVSVAQAPFTYPTSGALATVVFSPDGVPFTKINDAYELLATGEIVLARGGRERVVALGPITGRVSLQ